MSSVLKFALILLAAGLLSLLARGWSLGHQSQPAPPPETTRIRVAAAALPAGLLLREGDLGWKTVSVNDVPKGALTENSPNADLHGVLMRDRKEAGEPIAGGDVIRPDAPGFLAAALKPGLRAVSVPVDDVSGNAGLIQPGDFVDIILTQRLRQPENAPRAAPLVASETVVERVRIIAVGSSFQRKTDEDKSNRARTVTFEVSPRAAQAVTVAAQLGTLSMALRSFAVDGREGADDAQTPAASVVAWDRGDKDAPRPVWGGDVSRALSGVSGAPAAAVDAKEPSSAPRRVTILRGSQRQEQEFGQ